jgi:hypothetical protein
MASSVMRGQIARHVVREAKLQTWTSWILMVIARAYAKIRETLRL